MSVSPPKADMRDLPRYVRCGHRAGIAEWPSLTRTGRKLSCKSLAAGLPLQLDAAPCSVLTFQCQCCDSFLTGPDSTHHLWAADSQLVALYAEKACLILIWTGVDFVPRHIDPDRHPVFFNSILARISQHRIQQSCLLFKILGGSAMGSCKNDYPLTFRGEHQSALWVRTERFDGIPSVKLGNQRDDLPGSGKLLGSIICKRKS